MQASQSARNFHRSPKPKNKGVSMNSHSAQPLQSRLMDADPGVRGFFEVRSVKAHSTADLPMHTGGDVNAYQKGKRLSFASSRLHSLN